MTTRFTPVRKVLVANRGEIACRIMRTAKRMGIKTLAVYSSADSDAMHIKLADEACWVGEAEPQKSYLNQDKIFEVAHKHGVTAIHPGYGFLSENAEFSQRCLEEQLVFIGPSSNAIKLMGIKNESKRIMIEAGVPVVPGYHGLEQSNNLLFEEANKMGYPILIKPVRGGGGKGMRVVHREEDFIEALESSRRESLKSFNDQSMLLEKFISKPRHVEVQVFGDYHGNHVHLFERDCSVQRRHQKIIEEAPAPLLDEIKRQELGRQAVAAAKAVDYIGAGTVEFIFDKLTGEFYFMEMNTRLQVEHPITEMITNTDLVEWQFRVASGECLPKRQEEISISGHAFEARIYAEDPADNFLPQTGKINFMCLPDGVNSNKIENDRNDIRVDTGIKTNDVISPYYDPMIAKLVVWNQDREEALTKLKNALQQYVVAGVPTNIEFLVSLASNESFRAGDVGTDFIELHHDELFSPKNKTPYEDLIPEICATIHRLLSSHTNALRKSLNSFRIISTKRPIYRFNVRLGSSNAVIYVQYESHDYNSGILSTSMDDDPKIVSKVTVHTDTTNNITSVKLNEEPETYKFLFKSPALTNLEMKETILVIRNREGENLLVRIEFESIFDKAPGAINFVSDPTIASAPMPGIIEKVTVAKGDQVKKDQSLVIMSAMKMEYTIKSNIDGLIEEIMCKPGDFVSRESILVRLKQNVQ